MANAESGFGNYFALPVAPADTTITLGVAPTTTSGRVYTWYGNHDAPTQEEWINYTGVSGTTITGCTRGMSPTADPSTWWTGLTWIAWTPVILVWMHDQLVMKTKSNTYTAWTTQTFSASESNVSSKDPVYADATARDVWIPSPSNGMRVYNTAEWEFQKYQAWAWTNETSWWSTPNASTTVAGKVEAPTQTEVEQLATTGWTGALVFVTPTTINPASITWATPAYNDKASSSDTSNSNYLRSATYEDIAQNAINTRWFTAWENITAGDLLYMDADTSVYKTVRKASTVAQVWSITGIDTVTGANSMIWSAQLTTDKSILIYKKSADSLIYWTVVSFTRWAITVWTEQVIAWAALQADSGGTVCVLSSTLFVVSYKRNSDNFPYSVACTVSWTTITAGTATLMYNSNVLENLAAVSSCKVSATSFAVAVHDATLDDTIVVAATISWTTITPWTWVAMEAVTMNAAWSSLCCYVQDGVIAVAYDDWTNIKCNMATISGTTVTAKTAFTTSIAGYCTPVDQIIYIDYGRFLIIQNDLTTWAIRVISINVPNQSAWTTGIVMSNYYISNDNILSYAQVQYLGNNKVAVCNQMLNGGDMRLRIMDLWYDDMMPIYDTTIAWTVWDVSLTKLTTNQDKILMIYQDTGTTNLNYSLYWNTENQFIWVCKTTTSAAGTVPTATRWLAAISWLTAGQPYYVWDAGAVATSGTKQIWVATSTATLHIR